MSELYFYRTHRGADVDLFWQWACKNWAVEFKYMDAPKITKSMRVVLEDLELEPLWIVYPGKQRYALDKKITVLPLKEITVREFLK